MPGLSGAKSINDAKKGLRKVLRQVDSVTQQELETMRVNVETAAIAQVPVDTGRLQRSIRVRISRDKTRPGINVSAVAYDPETGENYAPDQHENLRYRHTVGKAHFLSDPLEHETEEFKVRMKGRMKKYV